MVSDREAWMADKIRRVASFLLAGGATLALLQVLFRMAKGRFRWDDPNLWIFGVLATVGILWVRATRQMPRASRQAPSPSEEAPAPDEGTPSD